MFERQKSGSVVCPSCGKLVGVNEKACFYCGRSRPGMWGMTKTFRDLGLDLEMSDLVLWGCGLAYILTLAVDTTNLFSGGLFSMLSPSLRSVVLFGASGVNAVLQEGHWWTLLSAGWLHGSLLHIGFNLYALRLLGPMTTEQFGGSRFIIIFTVGTVSGFVLSTLVGGIFASFSRGGIPCLFAILGKVMGYGGVTYTLGASAGLCGLLGALQYAGRRGGSALLGRQTKIWILSLAVFGLLLPMIDNWAHLGGLAGGYLAGRWLDPLKPERTDHVITAVVCLVLSAAAIAASVLSGFSAWKG